MVENETNEFLKLMKHSEYCIVDQLKKTPAKISIMSLILNSELHHNALQKVLNKAYIPQNVEQKTIENLVGRIHDANYLYFMEDELDAEETGHNKPLYVTVRCKIVSSVKLSSITAQPLMCYQGICLMKCR